MLIVVHVILMLLFTLFAGYGITNIFCLRLETEKKESMFLVIPIIGYVFSQVLFYQFYYFIENSVISFCLMLATLCLVNLAYLFFEHKRGTLIIERLKQTIRKIDPKILLVLLVVFILCSWQYLLMGEGNYYHSGNEDFFDGVIGGQVYLNNTPLSYMPEDFSGWIRLQYSSQAFTRILLRVGGVDGFLIQATLNLLLTVIGIYWLVITVFHGNKKTALLASFWSVCANLYLATFFNGHIGSLMYGSMAPIFIAIIILWSRKEINSYWLILAALLLYTIHITYPGPIFFILIPAGVLIIYKRILQQFGLTEKLFVFFGFNNQEITKQFKNKCNWFRVISAGIIVLIIAILITIMIYNYFEPQRISALLNTNVSWKISLFKEMLIIFWGIYPSGSTGIFSVLPIFISNPIINNVALILAGLLTVLVFIAAIKNRLNVNRHFLFLYSVFYIPFFIIMRYFWGSPYYFYKFLYVNFFLVVVILFLWISDFLISTKKQIVKYIFIGFLIFIGSLNIIWNFSIEYDFYTRPYNDKHGIEDFFSHTNKLEISQSYIEIPHFLFNLVFKYIFMEHGYSPLTSRKDAKYIIQLDDYGNVYHNSILKNRELYNNGLLKLFIAPSDDKTSTFTMYEPDHVGNINPIWVGNEFSLKRGILLSSLNNLTDFLEKSGNNSRTFIDISEKNTYILLEESLKSKGIKLQRSALNANWFIRIKGGRTIISDTKDSKEIWSDKFFKIISVNAGTKIRINILPEMPNFSGIVQEAQLNGNKIYIDIPPTEHLYLYLNQFLKEKGIEIVDDPAETKIFCRCIFNKDYEKLNYKTYSNTSEKVLWQSVSFNVFQRPWEVQLVKVPIKDRIINLNNRTEESEPFNVRTQFYGDFQINILNLTSRLKYLRILVTPGPSIDFSPFIIKIKNLGNGKEKLFNVFNPVTLIDININDIKEKSDTTLELFLQGQNLFGHSLLPLDDRYLNYQIQALELTDQVDYYSNYLLNVLNNRATSRYDRFTRLFIKEKEFKNIINKKDTAKVFLGMGWFPPEENDNETYRWVGVNPVEIIVDNSDGKNRILQLDLESGPGTGGKPLKLNIYNKDQFIKSVIISGREKIDIPLLKDALEGNLNQTILKIFSETDNVKIVADPRVLNYRVFNISFKKNEIKEKDIIDKKENGNLIQLGKGWNQYEVFNNEAFRWVGKESAEIVLKGIDEKRRSIIINLEPGPGCGGKPLDIKIFCQNKLLNDEIVKNRKDIIIPLPEGVSPDSKNEIILKLICETKNIKIASDSRIMNYRVFNISLKENEQKKRDIIVAESDNLIRLGKGWYPYEIYNQEPFRWVGKDPAEIKLNNIKGKGKEIELNLEPGPGCGGVPLKLSIYLNGQIIQKKLIRGREKLVLNIFQAQLKGESILKLVPITKNATVPNDKRTLNFRVFNILLR